MTASTITSPRQAADAIRARNRGMGPDMDTNRDRCPVCAQPASTFYPLPDDEDRIVGCSSHGNYWRGERLPRSSHPRVTVQRGGWSDNVYLDHVLAGVVHCPGGAERSYRAEALDGTTARFATRTAAENWFADR